MAWKARGIVSLNTSSASLAELWRVKRARRGVQQPVPVSGNVLLEGAWITLLSTPYEDLDWLLLQHLMAHSIR
jgi:hypothetical protein